MIKNKNLIQRCSLTSRPTQTACCAYSGTSCRSSDRARPGDCRGAESDHELNCRTSPVSSTGGRIQVLVSCQWRIPVRRETLPPRFAHAPHRRPIDRRAGRPRDAARRPTGVLPPIRRRSNHRTGIPWRTPHVMIGKQLLKQHRADN